MEDALIGKWCNKKEPAVMPDARRGSKVSSASNVNDGQMTNITPFTSDQMVRNLSMKIILFRGSAETIYFGRN